MLEVVQIPLEMLNLPTLLPMLVAVFGALVILAIDIFTKNSSRSFYTMLSVLFIVLDFGAVLYFDGFSRGFFDLLLIDGISILAQFIILIASALFIPLALTSRRFHEFSYPEFYALFLFMIAGFQFMVSSDSLILIFIGLETASLALYTLIAMHNRRTAFEAAIKYFTMGAVVAGFFTFGSMLLYVATGELALGGIAEVLIEREFGPVWLVFAGFVFLCAAIGFKISLVPFHTWTPDVYEGSNSVLAGYMSIVPKIAGFVVAMRFFDIFLSAEIEWVKNLLYLLVVLTITLPNIAALVQDDVKRMLAYSSISHAGFALAAIMINTTHSISALFLYWILFLFTNLGAFSMLWVSRNKINHWKHRYDHPYERFAGMVQIMPVGAVLMGIFMLSLAGIPPFALFWGKMYLMSAALNSGFVVLTIIMALNSAISVYYYLKLIVYMFLKELPKSDERDIFIKNASTPLRVILGFSAGATLVSLFFIDTILGSILKYVEYSGF
ncbi:MAG: NADH-quinone oxidoreductase subunit NuoN [Wolinella sp.]